MKINTILTGDCLEIMKTLPDNSIDAIVTDPPYGIQKGKIEGDESLETFKKSIPEFYRLLKDNSFCAVFTSIKYIPDILTDFKSNKFQYEWEYICYVNNGMVRGRMGFSCFMPVLIFTKRGGRIKAQLRDVCELSAGIEVKTRLHPYQKDVRFIKPLLKSITPPGGIVLDPFSGSGSTLIAAKQEGFNYLGIELNPEYVEIANTRLSKECHGNLNDFIPISEPLEA